MTAEKPCVIPPFEFEKWGVIVPGGIPHRVHVGDMGVGGGFLPTRANAPPAPDR